MNWSEIVPESFVLDTEKSRASLVIEPIRTTDGEIFHVIAKLAIEPYPNEMKMGGWWQITTVKSKKQAKECEFSFLREVGYWEHRGMKVTVEWKPQATRIRQLAMI